MGGGPPRAYVCQSKENFWRPTFLHGDQETVSQVFAPVNRDEPC
jgi:hypothetical protein